MKKILPKNVQYGFFFATFKESIVEYVKKLLPNIITIRLHSKKKEQIIEHWYTKVDSIYQAKKVILDLVTSVANGQEYVFTQLKTKIQGISDFLNSYNVQCKEYSSDLKPDERDKFLYEICNEKFKVLITSDIFEIAEIPKTYLVINLGTPIRVYEKPNHYQFNYSKNHQSSNKVTIYNCDTYCYRARLAGRFGRSGLYFTIALDKEDENNLKMSCSEKNLNIPLNYIEKSSRSEEYSNS